MTYLLVDEGEQSDSDLHAQVVQAKDGRLEEQEASGEEKAQAQGQEVALRPLSCMERVELGNDAPQELRLNSFRGFLQIHKQMWKIAMKNG